MKRNRISRKNEPTVRGLEILRWMAEGCHIWNGLTVLYLIGGPVWRVQHHYVSRGLTTKLLKRGWIEIFEPHAHPDGVHGQHNQMLRITSKGRLWI
jgi:hypothetical protein